MTREIRLGLVLDELKKQALSFLAELEGGLSCAATLRRLIREAARERGVWPADNEASPGKEVGNEC